MSATGNSIMRRKYINDDIGVLTFWGGYKIVGGKADATHLVRAAIAQLCSEQPYPPHSEVERMAVPIRCYEPPESLDPVYYDDPVDSLVHLLVFRDAAGETLGSVIRFATHVSNGEPGARTAGYPGFARRLLERELGGVSMFVLGPQGDSVPMLDSSGTEETRRIGEASPVRRSRPSGWRSPALRPWNGWPLPGRSRACRCARAPRRAPRRRSANSPERVRSWPWRCGSALRCVE